MSEYWKSTPKYWCKHCKTYVRDTALERTNHDATPRHQGNLKRFVRDLHRENERSERDKQRAKDEVARLNGAGGSGASAGPTPGGAGQFRPTVTFAKKEVGRNVTPDERKRQMAQLAEMGVAVPEEFRRENAMVGEWEVIAQRAVAREGDDEGGVGVKKEEGEEEGKRGLSIGVRKRKAGEEDGVDESEGVRLEEGTRRPKWGTDTRRLPGGDEEDLDALLGATREVAKRSKSESKNEERSEKGQTESLRPAIPETGGDMGDNQPAVKTEDPNETLQNGAPSPEADINGKNNVVEEDVGLIFKKRRPKTIKQR